LDVSALARSIFFQHAVCFAQKGNQSKRHLQEYRCGEDGKCAKGELEACHASGIQSELPTSYLHFCSTVSGIQDTILWPRRTFKQNCLCCCGNANIQSFSSETAV